MSQSMNRSIRGNPHAQTATIAEVRQERDLSNIRDRIQMLGGTVKLTSSTGRGTTLTISLPWPTRQPKTAPRRPIPPS